MKKKALRSISKDFKLTAVQRMEKGENVSQLARELKISRCMLYVWRTQVRRGTLLDQEEGQAELATAKNRVQELEQLVGQLTFENRFFAGALQQVEAAQRRTGR